MQGLPLRKQSALVLGSDTESSDDEESDSELDIDFKADDGSEIEDNVSENNSVVSDDD